MTTKNGYYNLSVWVETYLSFYFGYNNCKFKVSLTKKRGYDKQVIRSGVGCGRNNHF